MDSLNFTEVATLTFTKCAEICKNECIVFVRRNALNSNLWLVFASMFILTLFYMLNKNEEALKRVSIMTGQSDTSHIQKTIEWLLLIGIILLIVYIALFQITNSNIQVIR
jgi:hypothetical protein